MQQNENSLISAQWFQNPTPVFQQETKVFSDLYSTVSPSDFELKFLKI